MERLYHILFTVSVSYFISYALSFKDVMTHKYLSAFIATKSIYVDKIMNVFAFLLGFSLCNFINGDVSIQDKAMSVMLGFNFIMLASFIEKKAIKWNRESSAKNLCKILKGITFIVKQYDKDINLGIAERKEQEHPPLIFKSKNRKLTDGDHCVVDKVIDGIIYVKKIEA